MSLRESPSRRCRSQDRNNRTEKGMHRYRDRNSPYHPSYIQHDVRSETRCNNYRSRSRERHYNGNSQRFNNRITKPSYHSRNWHHSSAPPSVPYNENHKHRNNSTSRKIAPRCSSLPFKATNSYDLTGTNGAAIASDPNQRANYTKVLKHLVISHLLTQLVPAKNITEQHFENFPLKFAEDGKTKKDSDKSVYDGNKYVDDHDDGYDADSEDGFDEYFFENLYYSSKLRKEIRKYHDIKKELMEISAEIQIKEKQDRNGGNDNNDINDNKICNETEASTITSQS